MWLCPPRPPPRELNRRLTWLWFLIGGWSLPFNFQSGSDGVRLGRPIPLISRDLKRFSSADRER